LQEELSKRHDQLTKDKERLNELKTKLIQVMQDKDTKESKAQQVKFWFLTISLKKFFMSKSCKKKSWNENSNLHNKLVILISNYQNLKSIRLFSN